jgi:hypothetical protein
MPLLTQLPLLGLAMTCLLGGCSASDAQSANVPAEEASVDDATIPPGMRSLPTGGSGTVLTATPGGNRSASALTQGLVRDLQRYFGGTLRVLNAFSDHGDTQLQASFRAAQGGTPVLGLLAITTEGGSPRAVVMFDAARALPSSIDRLVRVATGAGGGGTAAPAVALTRTPVPDGSGAIDLGPGWVIRYASKGAMDIQGPLPGSGMSLGTVLTVPFTSPDPVQALVIGARQLGRMQGKSIEVQIIDSRPMEWQQGGRAALIRYRAITDGQPMEYFGLIAITPFDGQQVFFYSSVIQAPPESFARILPTAMRSWASWSIYPSVLAQRMQQTAQTMRETGELLTRGSSSRAIDGVNAGWGQYIRGVATLEDSDRTRSEVDQSFADNVVRADPNRFRIVPTSELVP